MRKLLVKILLWCSRRIGYNLVAVPTEVQKILPAVVQMCRERENYPQLSGERKRAQVYAAILKANVEPRIAAKAIEFAIDTFK